MFLRFLVFAALLLATPAQAETDKVYHRVIKNQAIHCGYAEWPPFLTVDPTTKQASGLMRDLWDMIGRKLGLKINWQSAMAWGEITEAVRSNKIDIFCVGIWPDAGRMKNMLLSRPALYNAIYLYGRVDDTRFDNNYAALNDPSMTVSGQDGDVTSHILEAKFPHAKMAHIPALAQQTDMVMGVVTKKADATVLDVPYAEEFMKNNPGKLRQIKGPPFVMLPLLLPLATGEYQLKNMIDSALNDLINDGAIAALIKRHGAKETYAPEPDVRPPVAAP